jgi:hypothetical protein
VWMFGSSRTADEERALEARSLFFENVATKKFHCRIYLLVLPLRKIPTTCD